MVVCNLLFQNDAGLECNREAGIRLQAREFPNPSDWIWALCQMKMCCSSPMLRLRR